MGRKKNVQPNTATGFLLVNKPRGPSSNGVLNAIKRMGIHNRMGYAGTLDPRADGVLVVGLGRDATQRLQIETDSDKEYIATINMTAFSSTDDTEGEEKGELDVIDVAEPPSLESVQTQIDTMIGTIEQVPPVFSAIKKDGVKACDAVRRGEKVVMKPREVTVYGIEILEYEWPILKIHVSCSKGTYIRTIARDLGMKLGTGGYLTALTRTVSGVHRLECTYSLEDIKSHFDDGTLDSIIIPVPAGSPDTDAGADTGTDIDTANPQSV